MYEDYQLNKKFMDFRHFVRFLRSPIYFENTLINYKDIIQLLFAFLIIILIAYLNRLFNSFLIRNSLLDYKPLALKADILNNKEFIYILVLLILPFFEELTWRLFLRVNKFTVATSISGLYIYLFSFFKESRILILCIEYTVILSVIIVAMIFIITYHNFGLIRTFILVNFNIIYYLSAFTFGISHITNFQYTFISLLISPVICFSKICFGLFLGYLRMCKGFTLSITFHFFFNLIMIYII